MSSPPKNRHLLTILVEDYFHVGAFDNLIQQRNWQNFVPRYEQNTLKTLDLLDRYGAKATFFVLGWIAERNPSLIREIVARGHEVASRGFYHRSLNNLTAEEFRVDLRRTNQAIESACGQKVVGYRAAEKLRGGKDDWVLDVLAEEGFAYDASFMPDKRTEKSRRLAHQIHTGGKAIWEFPYATRDLGIGLLPISGGNYIRQIPFTLMRHAISSWHKQTDQPFPFYFHVWELDPEQPRISAASRFNRVRHYRKLDKMEWILNENLDLYDCTSIARHLGLESEPPAAMGDVNSKLPQSLVKPLAAAGRSTRSKEVTIVIPCYNEQEALPYLANTLSSVESELANSGYEPTFIFVDDRSKDDTLSVLNELFASQKNVRIVQHESNQGVAAGVMSGLRAAQTEIVCSMDCDCTYDPHELVKMLPLLEKDVDLVTASPYHGEGGVRNVPSWRLFLSRGASFLYRRVLRSKLDTYTSCFRVYRRSSFADIELTENGFLGVAEMLGRVDLAGGKIVEFPTVLEVRLFGFSKMRTVKTVAGHLRLLARLAKSRFFGKFNVIKPSLRKKELLTPKKSTD